MTSLHCEVWGGFFFSVASGKTSCHVACPVTSTPKHKESLSSTGSDSFLYLWDKNKPNNENIIRFFANFRIIYYLCTQNNNYNGCNV